MATTKKTSTKKTPPKKNIDKPSIGLNDSLLKKNGIDELSLDDLIKFARKEKVEIPDIKDDSDRVNIVLPVLAHLAQKEDLLLGFGILDILNDGYGFLRNPDTDDNNDDIALQTGSYVALKLFCLVVVALLLPTLSDNLLTDSYQRLRSLVDCRLPLLPLKLP